MSPARDKCRLFCRLCRIIVAFVAFTEKQQKIRPNSLPINEFTVVRQDGSSPQSGNPLNEAISLKKLYVSLDVSAERFVIYEPPELLGQEGT